MTVAHYRPGSLLRVVAVAVGGIAGCATTPEVERNPVLVEGTEEEVVCAGACEEEWRRAEEWVKKYSGYPFPAEVTVTPDRITAARLPYLDCDSVPQTRRPSGCPDLPLASEPLGIGLGEKEPGSRIGQQFANRGPHWTFSVRREAQESGSSRIRLIQSCRRDQGVTCRAPGIAATRQDDFRRFVRTGERSSP